MDRSDVEAWGGMVSVRMGGIVSSGMGGIVYLRVYRTGQTQNTGGCLYYPPVHAITERMQLKNLKLAERDTWGR